MVRVLTFKRDHVFFTSNLNSLSLSHIYLVAIIFILIVIAGCIENLFICSVKQHFLPLKRNFFKRLGVLFFIYLFYFILFLYFISYHYQLGMNIKWQLRSFIQFTLFIYLFNLWHLFLVITFYYLNKISISFWYR